VSFLKLLRPSHWIKNFFVLMPIFFAGQLSDSEKLTEAAIAFCAFCAMASAIYIINDIRDIEADKAHPEKKKRPIASGDVSKSSASLISVGLMLLSVGAGYFVSKLVCMGLLIYLIMNLAYSFGLKKVAILDVSIIAIGFVLRVLVGGWATELAVSHWLIIDTFLLAMILGLSKRRAELNLLGKSPQTRSSLSGYNQQFLDLALVMFSGVTLVSYIMYCVSDEVVARLDNPNLYLTSIFVLLGLTRYVQQMVVENSTLSPVSMILKDRFLQLTVTGWVITFGYIIYG
jgi:decaprenyl-phosphate phosphoribosyltransferase